MFDNYCFVASGEDQDILVSSWNHVAISLPCHSPIWAIRILKEEELVICISEDGFLREYSYSVYHEDQK